ncbi:hypothetical protein [Brachybacterium huguangmaarense]
MIPARVTAIVLVLEDDDPDVLEATLEAVRAQTRPPDDLRVLEGGEDEDHDDLLRALARELIDDAEDAEDAAGSASGTGTDTASHAPRGRSRRRPATARRVDADGYEDMLWLLTSEAAPGPDALRAQLATARSTGAAVVGAKRLLGPLPLGAATADEADRLCDVGLTATHGARAVRGTDDHEIDQGQHDERGEVLAVALPGILLEESALREIGGGDPALHGDGAAIAWSHRVWRSGRRVRVEPSARVVVDPAAALIGTPGAGLPDASSGVDPRTDRPARPEAAGAEDATGVDAATARAADAAARTDRDERAARSRAWRDDRAARISTAMAMRSLPVAVLALLALLVVTPVRMAGGIVTHSPRRVLDELVAALRAVGAWPGVVTRAARASRRARIPRREIAGLFLSRRAAARRALSRGWASFVADDDRSRRIRRTTWGIAGTSHGARDADYGRHTAWTLVLVVASLVLTALGLRPLLRAGDLVGPGLVSLPARWQDSWQAAFRDWVPGGLGSRGPADPLVRVLAHLPVPGEAVVEVILLGALPCAALAAWWASGALTRAVGARLVAAATWALAPPLLASVIEGRWPFALVHVLLPLLALAIGRAIGLVHKTSQASVAAAAAGGLVLLVIGAVQPVLVLLVGLALALLAPAVRGRRARLLWVLLPSLALHAPYVPEYVAAPRALLAAGAQHGVAGGSAPGAALLALWPTAPPVLPVLEDLLGSQGAVIALLAAPALVALAAIAAPFLVGDAGRAGRLFALLAGAALALALVAEGIAVGVVGDSLVTTPLHAIASCAALAVLGGALCTFDALARRDAGIGGSRRTLTAVAGALVALTTAAGAATWALSLPGALRVERVDSAAEAQGIPAVAADAGRDPARIRTLVLDAPDTTSASEDPAGAARTRLVVDGGPDALQVSGLQGARDVRAVRQDGSPDTDPASALLLTASAGLLAGDADPDPLASLAIGYVSVPGDPADHTGLVRALDASPLLEQVSAGPDGTLWRLVEPTARARVLPGAGTEGVVLTSEAVDATGRLEADPDAPRMVVLSERASGAWSAEVDGRALQPVTVDGWSQGFVLPQGVGGALTVTAPVRGGMSARILLYAVTILALLVALPWRGRALRTGGER